jgi:sugar O-acyltransferase (sialic acid O-acetyltransferase NeuD family)
MAGHAHVRPALGRTGLKETDVSPRKLVLIGDGEFAEIAYEYFTHDSPYDVVAFAVESAYLSRDELFGLPVVSLERLPDLHSPAEADAFVAVTNTQLNRVRTRLFHAMRAQGYRLASYVSSRAFVWHNVQMGDNCFIFENNVIQYHVQLGDNVVLWSGNHVGHRSVIRSNCFITSHVVISGYCDVGENCFIGVNASVGDHIQIARDCIIGMGSVIVRPTEPGKVYVGNPARALEKSSYDTFSVPEEAR